MAIKRTSAQMLELGNSTIGSPPSGTVTFMFTDIEGSTKMWEESPEAMRAALARHDAILREAIESNAGYVFKTGGDSFYAAFPTGRDALAAAIAAQSALRREDWGSIAGW
jgi:class 3 adenylate cyclase